MNEKPRVLAVDDERRGVELVARTLRKLADVSVATCGDDAWALFQEAEYDLVISDQRMPGMSGVELLSRIADREPFTGRILLTGYADIEATIDAINKGRIHFYIHKPCSADQLRMITASVIERVHLERTNARLLEELSAKNDELEEILASLRREQKSMVEAARGAAISAVAHRGRAHLASLRAIGGELSTTQAPSIERARRFAEQILAVVTRLEQVCRPPTS
jgi:response regulator RpfG family c-di-GMP phosphodiesterase